LSQPVVDSLTQNILVLKSVYKWDWMWGKRDTGSGWVETRAEREDQ